jgi:secondary thiamine-phosphate synthase enzyme
MNQIVNISSLVKDVVDTTSIQNGTLICFVTGTTAGLTVIEDEPGVIEDLKDALERLAPSEAEYAHSRSAGDGNGCSHVRGAFLGPSLAIPVINGRPTLGTWQQIVLVDCDIKPRTREVIVQVLGE